VTPEDLNLLLKAFGFGFLICGAFALGQPASAGTMAVLWTIGGVGLGGCAAILGTPNAGWMMLAAPSGAWLGNICGAIVRGWFESKDN